MAQFTYFRPNSHIFVVMRTFILIYGVLTYSPFTCWSSYRVPPLEHSTYRFLINYNRRGSKSNQLQQLSIFNIPNPHGLLQTQINKIYMGSSTETVAFQVYEIWKINHEFLQFFDWDQKYKSLRHHFQYLAQFIAPRGGSGDYGTSFAVVSTTIDFPSS